MIQVTYACEATGALVGRQERPLEPRVGEVVQIAGWSWEVTDLVEGARDGRALAYARRVKVPDHEEG